MFITYTKPDTWRNTGCGTSCWRTDGRCHTSADSGHIWWRSSVHTASDIPRWGCCIPPEVTPPALRSYHGCIRRCPRGHHVIFPRRIRSRFLGSLSTCGLFCRRMRSAGGSRPPASSCPCSQCRFSRRNREMFQTSLLKHNQHMYRESYVRFILVIPK